jgi:hypothetical protein
MSIQIYVYHPVVLSVTKTDLNYVRHMKGMWQHIST